MESGDLNESTNLRGPNLLKDEVIEWFSFGYTQESA